MQYLLLGLAALLLFLLAARVYTVANPQVLARQLRIGAGVAALAGAGFLVFRGMVGYAMSLAALGSWLLWGGGGLSWGGFPGRAQKSPGQTSRVVTEHLEVELDHDTGDIGGRVLKGFFAGRQLEEPGAGRDGAPMAGLPLLRSAIGADPGGLPRPRAPDLARGPGARRGRAHAPAPKGA